MKSVFVYNPKSGSALKKSELASLTKQYNIHIDTWLPLSKSFDDRLTDIIKHKTRVFVYGGDGTIRAAATIMAHSSSQLVPLPGGTFNQLTKELNIPQAIDEALAGFSDWNERTIDIASVNGMHFLNTSSIGVYARSLELRKALTPRISKWPAAVWASAKELARLRVYTVTINGDRIKTPVVFISNNTYSLDIGTIGTRHRLDRGVLSLFTTKSQSRTSLVRAAFSILSTRKVALIEKTKPSFTLNLKRSSILVAVDGEHVRLATPLVYHSHASALHLIAPR